MPILLLIAFVSGLVTILSPCIWPLLPIIFSTSIGGSKRRSLGITLGVLISFGILTLSITYIVRLIGFDPEIIRYLAVLILITLGITMIVPRFAQAFEGAISRISSKFGISNSGRSGFTGGFITGLSLGVVWTPCAGPILSAIASLSATASLNSSIIIITIAYLIGAGIPLFIFSYGSQRIISKTRGLSKHVELIQQIFGVVLILTAISILTNFDKTLQAKLLNLFPQYTKYLTSFEESKTVQDELGKLNTNNSDLSFDTQEKDNSSILNATNKPEAPDFIGINNWINSKPLSIKDLRGKVVLVDFWTYTCINCIRTLPYVTTWYDKYKDDGLVVIGVHTPEFEFEKDTANVEDAVKRFGITYPVAQDNDYLTWRAYNNRYWPAKYLIDRDGLVRYYHFGEGEYDTTEKAIQILLGNKTGEVSKVSADAPSKQTTPETYIGSSRMEFYYPRANIQEGNYTLSLDDNIPVNSFSLGGRWDISSEYSMSYPGSILREHFNAKKVFLVMRPTSKGSKSVKIMLDGKPITDANSGKDVIDGTAVVDSDRLYELVNLDTVEDHTVDIEFEKGEVEVFAFTFG